MHILDIKNRVRDSRIQILENIYRNTGDNCMSGYLEYGINNIGYDEFDHLFFDSYHLVGDDFETLSHGTILDDNSLIIKQIQTNNKDKNYYQIFAVSSDGKKYTYLDFESEEAMMDADFRIRRNNANLCSGELSDTLRSIGVDFDNIGQVRVNVNFPNAELNEMVNNNQNVVEETNTFIMY